MNIRADEVISTWQDRITRTRRSIVAIRSDALYATGWVGLANGVIVTSRTAVGYPEEVTVELEDGRRSTGRVISVDVACDISLILCTESLSLMPLTLRSQSEPQFGEPISALSFYPGRDLCLFSGRISSVGRGPAKNRTFGLDIPVPAGTAVLDAEAHVLGVSISPPIASSSVHGQATLLAAGSIQTLLTAFDRPSGEIQERTPVYRCAGCEEPFETQQDRCLTCGRVLPHVFGSSDDRAAVERLVRDGLALQGITANRVRTGKTSWRITKGDAVHGQVTYVDITFDDKGAFLSIRVPVVTLPVANYEPFYRFLLTMNDQTTGDYRISIINDEVWLTCAVLAASCSDRDVAMLFEEIVKLAEEYRKTLSETFDAKPYMV